MSLLTSPLTAVASAYKARCSLSFRYSDGEQDIDVPLIRYGSTLLSAPDIGGGWSASSEDRSYIGSRWAGLKSTGNASKSLTAEIFIAAPTVAQAEAAALRLEYELNTHRLGEATLSEAYQAGAPLLVSRWEARIENALKARLSVEEAPAALLPSSGYEPSPCLVKLSLELKLSNPRFL